MKILCQLLLGCFLVLSHVHVALGHVGHVPSPQVYGLHRIDSKAEPLSSSYEIDTLNRSSFPHGFVFGAASSAYQVEGAWNADGKGPNLWDSYTHAYPERIADHSDADIAADSYSLYKKDVELLKEMHMDAYRLSISWSRVLPHGKLSGGVNEKGIEYYNKLIDELLENGVQPYVTIFHFDLPQALEDEYGGFRSHRVVKDFHDFAKLCFERFGDRVKHWITINEPYTFSVHGYSSGFTFAPQRCSSWVNPNCTGGDSSTEPYLVTHHLILAHAHAVKLYKTKYQARQKGKIGITINSNWLVPLTNSPDDHKAAIRGLDFMLGWFMDPLIFGDYPSSMRANVGHRLPRFKSEEAKLVKGSFDFIGLNYYTSTYASNINDSPSSVNISYFSDQRASFPVKRNGKFIGEQAGSDWLYIYPRGISDLLLYVKKKYDDPIIYITENGVDELNNPSMPLHNALEDSFRIRYYNRHLSYVLKAIHEGVRVEGYFGHFWTTLNLLVAMQFVLVSTTWTSRHWQDIQSCQQNGSRNSFKNNNFSNYQNLCQDLISLHYKDEDFVPVFSIRVKVVEYV